MARKRYKTGEIVAKHRQVDVLVSQGTRMAEANRPRSKNNPFSGFGHCHLR